MGRPFRPADGQAGAGRRSKGARRIAFLAVSVALLAAAGGHWAGQPSAAFLPAMARLPVVPTPAAPRPDYLAARTDPVFGTSVTRVTDPGRSVGKALLCTGAHCRHRYSSTQAWNADQSLLVITNGCSGMCFLDGQTYQPLFHRPMHEDCKWHPQDAERMVCVYGDRVTLWSPRDDAHTVIYRPDGYSDLAFGPYKGNLSDDGRRMVLRARDGAGALVAFAYDIAEGRKFADIAIASLPGRNGYCGISASGRFIACFQTLPEGTETVQVLTPEGRQVQLWSEHHRPGHGDMAIDVDGSDVYIGVSKADPDKWHVIKRRLDDGTVTDLTPPGFATHASVRNIARPGWVFLTYEGTYAKAMDRVGWTPFYREVVALRTDGSGEVRRIAHTHNSRSDYDSESHVSPSPDGSQVIWSSNWGDPNGPVADYVARVPWPPEPGGDRR